MEKENVEEIFIVCRGDDDAKAKERKMEKKRTKQKCCEIVPPRHKSNKHEDDV